jgi:L-amino acid N-acyltransferase YncA
VERDVVLRFATTDEYVRWYQRASGREHSSYTRIVVAGIVVRDRRGPTGVRETGYEELATGVRETGYEELAAAVLAAEQQIGKEEP